ncbi:MAG TPA: PH domain-containing protein, partial [Kineosporiaceae bacterium]|nr:PH domain-containing protein [Kineosporiaceae bacterium]
SSHLVTGGRLVYQPGYSRVLLGIFVAFGLWWVIDEAMGSHPARAVVTGLWLVAIAAALACMFWRPAVVVDDAGVELRNLVRDVRVPWPALEALDTRYALTLHSRGRRYQSWAGAAPGRPSVTSRLISGQAADAVAEFGAPDRRDHVLPDPRWTAGGGASSSRDLRADSGATAFMIEQRWQAWRDQAGPSPEVDAARHEVVVRWRPVLPAVSAAAALLAVVLSPLMS